MADTRLKHHRILLVSPTWPGSLGGYCRDALDVLGQNMTVSPWPEKKSRLPGFGGKLIRLTRYLAANVNLLRVALQFRPEVLFVMKGRWVHPITLKRIQQNHRTILLNWNPDSPFNPINASKWLLQAIPVYDCHFTWGKYLIPELKKAGAKRVEYLPFAYDSRYHFPVEGLPKTTDVCFIGTWEPEREKILKQLTDFNLGVWGDLWVEKVTDEKLRRCWRGPARYGRDMCNIYGTSKIILNLIRKQNRTSHNMRTFEVPATKSFMLTTRTKEQTDLFNENESIACFNDTNELIEQIRYFLRHEAECVSIARRGFLTVTQDERHTYRVRMAKVLTVIQSLFE